MDCPASLPPLHTPNLTHAPTSGNTFRSPDQKDVITSSISHILPDYPYPCHPHSSSSRCTSNATPKPRQGASNSRSPSLAPQAFERASKPTREPRDESLHPGRDLRHTRHATQCSTHPRPSILADARHSSEGSPLWRFGRRI